MHKPLFLRILNDVTTKSHYMQQRSDCTGSLRFSELQKCAIAIRQLAYGSVSYSWDEYFQMSERTALESLDIFAAASSNYTGTGICAHLHLVMCKLYMLIIHNTMVYLVCLVVLIVFTESGMVAV